MKYITSVVALLFSLNSIAQYNEIGIFGGVASYSGDLSAQRFVVKDLKESYGVFVRHSFNDFLTGRIHVMGGRLQGNDANTSPNAEHYEYKLERNLSFRSSLVEVGGVAEFNLFGFQPYNLRRIISPYGFVGISAFRYNPKAEYGEDNWVELQPLGTEGQGMAGYESPYKLISFAIPFGAGLKVAVNDLWNVGFEIGLRKTFTDYIDDVGTNYVSRPELLAGNGELAANLANRTGEYLGTEPVVVATGTQRGDSTVKDWYTLIGITFSYNFLDNGLVGWRRRNARGNNGCPTNF